MRSDLASTFASLGGAGFDVALDADPGPGWIRLDRYAVDPIVLDAGLRLAGRRFGQHEPSAASGGWLVGDIAAVVAWPAVAALLIDGGLLVDRSSDVHLPHPNSGRRLAARIVPSERRRTGSPETFAAGIATALRPLLEAVHRRTRRGRHALSCTITDMVAAAFHRVGDRLDVPDEARALASAIIDGAGTLTGGANWNDLTWAGGTERTRTRNICCLWYRAPEGQLCLTCPRITDADRRTMLERRALR